MDKALAGCKGVNVEGGAEGGVGFMGQTGAIKMQIISFRAAIFPEEREPAASYPTPLPINLELIYGDDSAKSEETFCLGADRAAHVNTG